MPLQKDELCADINRPVKRYPGSRVAFQKEQPCSRDGSGIRGPADPFLPYLAGQGLSEME